MAPAAAPPALATVGLREIEEARARLEGRVRRTPTVPAPEFGPLRSEGLFLKLECFQRTGSFKIRGATNKILSLSEAEAKRGVVAASAGNHAQGVAWAARDRGIPATIVMARTASPLKVRGTRELGAHVVLHGNDYEEAHQEADRIARETGATVVHPFDDPWVIAGQGTVGLEILEAVPDVRRVVVGVGGGGLISGIAAAIHGRRPDVEIVGVKPAGADTLGPAMAAGHVVVGGPPRTWADGLATRFVGELPFRLMTEHRVRPVAVDDRTVARASFLLLEKAKVLAEGAGATPLAALLEDPSLAEGGPVVLVVSGGNLDPFLLDRVLFLGLSAEGRLLRLRAPLGDTPGRLAEFLRIAAEAQANVRQIVHDRDAPDRLPGEVEVTLELEVQDPEHAEEVLRAYRERGWPVAIDETMSGRVPKGDPPLRA